MVGNKVWIPAYKQGASASLDSVGFYCVNIAAVLASGGSPSACSTSYVPLATGTDVNVGAGFTRSSSLGLYEFRSIDGVSTAGSSDETRIWASLASNGKLVCLDTATGAALASAGPGRPFVSLSQPQLPAATLASPAGSLPDTGGATVMLRGTALDGVLGTLTLARLMRHAV